MTIVMTEVPPVLPTTAIESTAIVPCEVLCRDNNNSHDEIISKSTIRDQHDENPAIVVEKRSSTNNNNDELFDDATCYKLKEILEHGLSGWLTVRMELSDVITNEPQLLLGVEKLYFIHFHQVVSDLKATEIFKCLVTVTTTDDCRSEVYTKAVSEFASFLIDPSIWSETKIACLDVVLKYKKLNVTNPQQAEDDDETSSIELDGRSALAFCIAPKADSFNVQFLWELRAICLHLQDQLIQQPQLPIKPAPKRPLFNDIWWNNMKEFLYETKVVRLTDLDDLRTAYRAGVKQPALLASVSVLRQNEHHHSQALQNVAIYLSDPVPKEKIKLAVLKCLRCQSSSQQHEKLDDEFYTKALQFCIEKNAKDTDFFLDHEDTSTNSYFLLLWELRAICIHMNQQREEQQKRILDAVTTASTYITKSAETMGKGMHDTVDTITAGLDTAGKFIIENTQPRSNWLHNNPKSATVTLTYTGTARRASEHVLTKSAETIRTIKDVSSEHVKKVAGNERFMPRNPNHKTALQAVGHVALATLGAASIVGEAVISCTGSLARGAANVTGNVVQHKYGDTAGQVVRDVSDTTVNLLQTATSLTFFTGKSPSKVAKSIAKTTGRKHVVVQQDNNDNTTITKNDILANNNLTAAMMEDNDNDITSEFESNAAAIITTTNNIPTTTVKKVMNDQEDDDISETYRSDEDPDEIIEEIHVTPIRT